MGNGLVVALLDAQVVADVVFPRRLERRRRERFRGRVLLALQIGVSQLLPDLSGQGVDCAEHVGL